MLGAISRIKSRHAIAMGAGLAAFAMTVAAAVPNEAGAQTTSHEVTVTVTRFKALDKADEMSAGDFFARVTINGKAKDSAIISNKMEGTPKWQISTSVPPGVRDVKVQLIDNDVSVDDPIDINRVAGKRDIDFKIDTRSCRIDGFSQAYKCGATISRAGTEAKKAEISFTVSVKKS